MTKLLLFDYDNTLANHKSSLSEEVGYLINRLIQEYKVGVITGGRSFHELEHLFINNIPVENPIQYKNIFLLPEFGNKFYTWNSGWKTIFESKVIEYKEVNRLKKVLDYIDWSKYILESIKGAQFIFKGNVVSIDCLGSEATNQEKVNWDMDMSKRKKICNILKEYLGDSYNLYITGRNTIDLVPDNCTKDRLVKKLCDILQIDINEVEYFGDEFYEYGNDYPITELGIKYHEVGSSEETLEILMEKIKSH